MYLTLHTSQPIESLIGSTWKELICSYCSLWTLAPQVSEIHHPPISERLNLRVEGAGRTQTAVKSWEEQTVEI